MTYEKSGLYIDETHLEFFAENLARSIRISGEATGKSAAAELRKALRELAALHDSLALKWSGIPATPGAVCWLLDNHYLAQREGKSAAAELEKAEHLRFASGGFVLLRFCETLVRSGLYQVTRERMELFLRGFQRALILERSELSLLISGMKTVLIEELLKLYRRLDGDGEAAELETAAARLFSALRDLGTADLSQLLESADYAEQTLRQDPAGVYPRMTDRSREYYRRRLSELAKRNGIPEYKAAQRVLSLAKDESGVKSHVGYWLVNAPLGFALKKRSGGGYISAVVLLTLFFSLLLSFVSHSAAAFFLLLIPVSELVKSTADFLLLHMTKPIHVPRIALEDGVPAEGKTLCVVSALLTDTKSGPALCRHLEESRLLSRDAGKGLQFGVLADLPDSKEEVWPGGKEILSAAADAVDDLNAKYGGGFYLLTRPRTQSPDGRFCGWERKRGALLETMRLLRGEQSSVYVAAGDKAALDGTKYLLVLDSDTRLTPGAADELIGAMLHPLNRPVLDETQGIVTNGYGILAPRMSLELAAATKSDFSRIFAGQGGTDPYGGACSELYMDVWQRGGFAGKGIIDIDAYLRCMGYRVPENRMLSHDAVEGAFLRAGFVGDVELCDVCPSAVLSHYKRLERWTRGDWQNLPWLFHRGRTLPDLERWKLFDSLRRSLVPVMTLVALAAGFFVPGVGPTLSAVAALTALASEMLLTTAETLFHSDSGQPERYHSALFVGIGGGLVRCFLHLLLLPGEAWVCFSAICRALWRSLISKKYLLQWQTADQSDRLRAGLLRFYRELWFSALLGAVLLIFSPGIIGKTTGTLWLLSPLCALLLSLPAVPPMVLKPAERNLLKDYAADTWNYFAEFLTPEDHFLPPDNFQARPPAGLAHRTSPTNIGLALLSVLAAMDLGFVQKEQGLSLIGGCLDTLRQLPKWKGHLYNWYDTQTLAPLRPAYVSTVDSGNLCAALTTLQAGLREYGQTELSATAQQLADSMGFAPLFDESRKLFFIGWDTEKDVPTPSWYDLMASEARLTGYLAVARGDVPKEHWRRLSRAQVQCGPYRGMASWTGTMFEYLMPELLLPLQRESLLWESARFCLYVQQRRVRGKGVPWGISESAYWALDPTMNYRYKAHGCAGLALKRGMDDELVISPYSSFLALAVRPHAAAVNLQALEAAGMRGKYGFWEALDATESRLAGSEPRTVWCVMAHHAGMSLVAAANLLTEGGMQKRFLSAPAMQAYLGLLQEKLPVGGTVLHRTDTAERSKPPAVKPEGWEMSGSGTDFLRPRCCLLASQTYSLLVAETGLTRALWGGVSPYVSPRSPLDREKGIELFLELGGSSLPLLPDAYGEQSGEFSWQFSAEAASVAAVRPELGTVVSVSLADSDIGERRSVRLTYRGSEPAGAALILRFHPLLAGYKDYVNHPAFYGLGISARTKNGCLLLRRLPRGSTRELWMCLAVSRPCSFDLAPGATSGRAAREQPAGESEYFLTDPLVTAVCRLELEPDETAETAFALGMAYSETEAMESAARILKSERRAAMPMTAAAVIGMGPVEISKACEMLPFLVFPTAPAGPVKKEALWRFGISGDLPIVCADFLSDSQLPAARALMDRHLFLTGCGADFDLVLLSRDGASYHRPLHTALTDALWRAGGEVLRDTKGGVHIIEDTAEADCIRRAAVLCIDLDTATHAPERQTDYRAALPSRSRRFPAQNAVRSNWTSTGEFQFYVNHSLPPRVWQNILTNGRIGFLATDCGSGNLWYLNAREYQISPWLCQPNETEGPERLLLEQDGRRSSLFAAPADNACRVRYLPGGAIWETKIGGALLRTTAFVPPDTDARVLLIECDHSLPDAVLHWQINLQLGGSREAARYCRTAAAGGFLAAENVQAMAQARPFLVMANVPLTEFTCERAAALSFDYDGKSGYCTEPVLAAKLPCGQATVLVCGCETPDKLRPLTVPDAAAAKLQETLEFWKQKLSGLSLHSPELALDWLMNGWIAYQTLSCRLFGRCSIYQSGGAYGFRDQLQDAVNLIGLDSSIARQQLLRCCAKQYEEGDVQHWWHEGDSADRGVRTHCSDDLLWLPWALCEYVEKTGDESVCGETAAYLSSSPLSDGERDRYEAAAVSARSETVLQHCCRAMALIMERGVGSHGLLLIGSGDWNDGFDCVGGESVWLSWFFLHTAERFAPLLERHGGTADALRAFVRTLAEATLKAWNGKWFLRGYYADGTPMGNSKNAECRIDAIAQSWAAFCASADPEKTDVALQSALDHLFDQSNGLLKLFDPPFAGREHPGYIECYGPGFRENGGQYTHGALWLVQALLYRGRADDAWTLLSALLPAEKDSSRYLTEPFVLPADVYAAPGHEGEGGWSWYTGSAGWLLRIVTEDLLGLRLRSGKLFIEPNLPSGWSGYSAVYRGHRIEVQGQKITIDGRNWDEKGIAL